MQKIKRNIPNAITCGNLFFGCMALVKAFEGDLVLAAYFVGIALVLDFFDGFAARMLHVSSAIGKDLDSLADMVTFGVVPGVVMFQLLKQSVLSATVNLDGNANETLLQYLPYLAFIITIFSAIRLARFNNDTRQTHSFIGLPTPANAIFFCSIPLITNQISSQLNTSKNPFETLVDVSSNPILSLLNNYVFLLVLIVVFSYLLIAEIPLFALKFKNFSFADNKVRFLFLGLSVLLIILLKYEAVPVILIVYILLSVVNNLVNRSKNSVE